MNQRAKPGTLRPHASLRTTLRHFATLGLTVDLGFASESNFNHWAGRVNLNRLRPPKASALRCRLSNPAKNGLRLGLGFRRFWSQVNVVGQLSQRRRGRGQGC